MILDVGCGSLSDHKRRNGIGLDLQRGTCDIVGDTHYLPFKNEAFNFVYARNILEHLDNPTKALIEIKRVMKFKGNVSITIPIRHNPCVDEMLMLVFGFPFRLIRTLRRLIRWHKHRFDKGFCHKNTIKVKHISKLFFIRRFEPIHENISLFKTAYPFPSIHYIYGEKL